MPLNHEAPSLGKTFEDGEDILGTANTPDYMPVEGVTPQMIMPNHEAPSLAIPYETTANNTSPAFTQLSRSESVNTFVPVIVGIILLLVYIIGLLYKWRSMLPIALVKDTFKRNKQGVVANLKKQTRFRRCQTFFGTSPNSTIEEV